MNHIKNKAQGLYKPLKNIVSKSKATAAALKDLPEHQDIKPFDSIPRPKGVPYIGNLEDCKNLYEDNNAHAFFMKRMEEYGQIYRIKLYKKESVVIFDHRHTREIIRAEGRLPEYPQINDLFVAQRVARSQNNEPMAFVLRGGDDVATIRRAIGRRSLVPAELFALLPVMNKAAKDAIKYMFEHKDAEGRVNLEAALPRFMLEVAGYFIFGNSLGTFEPETQQVIDDFLSFPDGAKNESLRYLWHVWPAWIAKRRPGWKKYMVLHQKGRDLLKEYVGQAVKNYDAAIAKGIPTTGLLEDMIEQIEDPELRQGAVDDLMLGGAGPGSTVAIDGIWRLAQNQGLQDTLLKELLPVMSLDGEVSREHLTQLPYLDAVYKESVRYTVPGGITARHSLADDTVMFGYHIPKGVEIIQHQYAISRNPALWSDPMTFNPERWLGKGKEVETANRFMRAIPFGVGARMCPGKRIVQYAVPLIYAHLIRNFHVEMAMEGDLGLVPQGMNFNAGPAYVHLTPRTS